MAGEDRVECIVPTTGPKSLPIIEILTGRGFITGKSGSGKSNSAGVIVEELLDANYNLLIVDSEGEYYGLKEKYEILHVGNSALSDVQVTPHHGDQLAEIALEQNMPIVLDVSEYLDGDKANELIANVVRALFQKEKETRKPFLLMIEEMQEYLPQQGGNDELGELLERIAKRGRKRGLGMLGMSQRPSSVDKDFITQCDWMVWHRLTWKNDLDVVKNVLGSEKASVVENLDTGEAFLMTDWDERVDRVQFKRKQTHDAGATPGLESYERPDIKSVSRDLIQEIESKTDESEIDSESNEEPETPFDDEINELDDQEFREWIETLQQQNQALTDEVLELRRKVTDVESQSDPEATVNQSGSTTKIQGDERAQHGAPPKPLPPDPPNDRTGAAGNLVEFAALIIYLMQALSYRCRLLWFRIRWGSDESETVSR